MRSIQPLGQNNQPTGQHEIETTTYLGGVEWKQAGGEPTRLHAVNASAYGRTAFTVDEATGETRSRLEYYHTDHLGNVRLAFSDLDGNGTITVGDIYAPDNEVVMEQHYYPFGLSQNGPWFATVHPDNAYRYNGKELDEAVGLYDYGARYYDPAIARWGQVDPLAEHPNQVDKSPYAYAWNNPVLLNDPDGKCPRCAISVGRIGIRALKYRRALGGGTFRAILTAEGRAIVGDATTVIGRGIKIGSRLKAVVDLVLGTDLNKTNPEGTIEADVEVVAVGDGIVKTEDTASEIEDSSNEVKGYSPNRELPRTKHGEPDAEADGATGAHTQLGKRQGRNGSYRQAREFDENEKPVKDIDFTNHGRPENHPNPHQHRYRDSKTGGTRQRGKQAEPLDNN